jgi:hypothetical protein
MKDLAIEIAGAIILAILAITFMWAMASTPEDPGWDSFEKECYQIQMALQGRGAK